MIYVICIACGIVAGAVATLAMTLPYVEHLQSRIDAYEIMENLRQFEGKRNAEKTTIQ